MGAAVRISRRDGKKFTLFEKIRGPNCLRRPQDRVGTEWNEGAAMPLLDSELCLIGWRGAGTPRNMFHRMLEIPPLPKLRRKQRKSTMRTVCGKAVLEIAAISPIQRWPRGDAMATCSRFRVTSMLTWILLCLSTSLVCSEDMPQPIRRHADAIKALKITKYSYLKYKLNERGEVVEISLRAPKINFISDDALRPLAELDTLKSLDLASCANVTDKGLEHLATLNHLERLTLGRNKIHGEGLASLKKLTKMKSLVLGNPISDEELRHLGNFQQLVQLSLYGTRVTDAGIDHVAGLTNLRDLNLNGTVVTDKGIHKLQSLTKLESLVLPCAATDEMLCSLVPMTQLRRLRLGRWVFGRKSQSLRTKRVTMEGVFELITGQQKRDLVTAIGVMGLSHELDDEGNVIFLSLSEEYETPKIANGVIRFCNRLNKLERLTLGSSSITDEGFMDYQPPPTLTSLRLTSDLLTGRVLSHVNSMHGLKLLVGPGNTTGAQMAHLTDLKKLESIELSGRTVDSTGMKHLASLSDLRVLRLHATSISNESVAQLTGLRKLRELSFRGTALGDASLTHLGQLTQLTNLDLSETGITDAGLTHLQGLLSLEELDTTKTKVTSQSRIHLFRDLQGRSALDVMALEGAEFKLNEAGEVIRVFFNGHKAHARIVDEHLAFVAGLKQLEELLLYKQPITGTGLAVLAELPKLKRLSLYRCEQLQDSALEHIARVNSLEHLNLNNCKSVTDAGLEHIFKMSSLKQLGLQGTKTSVERTRALQAKLKGAKIYFPWVPQQPSNGQ